MRAKKPQNQLIDQGRLASASRTSQPDHLCHAATIYWSPRPFRVHSARSCLGLRPTSIVAIETGRRPQTRNHKVTGPRRSKPLFKYFTISSSGVPAKKIRSTPRPYMISASSWVIVPPPPPKSFDRRRKALLLEAVDDFLKEFNVTAVIRRKPDCDDVLLNSCSDDILRRAMIPEVNHLNAVMNKFQIDRVNGTVVTVANWNCRQDSNRMHRMRNCFETPSSTASAITSFRQIIPIIR